MCDLEEKVHFNEERKATLVAGRILKPEESDRGIQLRYKPQTLKAPGCRIPPSFALFAINGVNSSANVLPLCEEDNTQREKSVQHCFIFMPLPDRKISLYSL